MSSLKRPSQLWLAGDVGTPKIALTKSMLPPSGYNTDITVIKPIPGSGWVSVPAQKQAACRHTGRAVFSFCDGHVENWKWQDLVTDLNDVFAINSF